MKFTKMHGIGNDYVYVNCFEETVPDPAEVARRVSDRHFGIGSDGLILIKPCAGADCEMEMYNADGSRGAMCGNGIRCVAKYAYDHGIAKKERLSILTGAGMRELDLTVEDGKAVKVRVDMGEPKLDPEQIPVDTERLARDPAAAGEGKESLAAGPIINAPIEAGGRLWRITAVSMGNPHAVTFVDSTDVLDLEKTGPYFENHPAFPDRVNTEFVEKVDAHTVKMRVWERGSGETLACGTGACAVAVASVLNGVVEGNAPVTVRLLGGDLSILWDRETNHVFMTGPATEVFHGEIGI